MLTVLVNPRVALVPAVIADSTLFPAMLGGFGAYATGARVVKAALRVTVWRALPMGHTAGVGALFGAVV